MGPFLLQLITGLDMVYLLETLYGMIHVCSNYS